MTDKTLASEVKKGQIIKYGNLWGKALGDAKQSSYKSNEVDIEVITIAATINRRAANCKPTNSKPHNTTFSFRKTTKVNSK